MKNNKVTIYVRESVGELKKVTWPKKDEVINSTIIVIIVIIVISLILGIFDFGVKEAAKFLLGSK